MVSFKKIVAAVGDDPPVGTGQEEGKRGVKMEGQGVEQERGHRKLLNSNLNRVKSLYKCDGDLRRSVQRLSSRKRCILIASDNDLHFILIQTDFIDFLWY